MSPIADTVSEMFHRAPEAFAAWALFGVMPLLVPAALVVFERTSLAAKIRFCFSCAAQLLGVALLLVLLIGVPWFVAELFLVPVALDAYPAVKPWLNPLLALTSVLVRTWFWLVPLVWLGWLVVGGVRARRLWRTRSRLG